MKWTMNKKCKHRWDCSVLIWGTDGKRSHPCKKCGELLVVGTVRVREAR